MTSQSMKSSVKILVLQQGDAVVGQEGYSLRESPSVVAFCLDGWGKTGRIYTVATSVTSLPIGTPIICVENGEDNSELTEITFPEYEGWSVFCTTGGKTMSICLVKD